MKELKSNLTPTGWAFKALAVGITIITLYLLLEGF